MKINFFSELVSKKRKTAWAQSSHSDCWRPCEAHTFAELVSAKDNAHYPLAIDLANGMRYNPAQPTRRARAFVVDYTEAHRGKI